jgi:hypothetical protein
MNRVLCRYCLVYIFIDLPPSSLSPTTNCVQILTCSDVVIDIYMSYI